MKRAAALVIALALALAGSWALRALTAPADCEPTVNLGAWARRGG